MMKFVHGHLSARQHMHQIKRAETDEGQWLKLALHHLWTLVWQVWLTGNEDLHGRDAAMKKNARCSKSYAQESLPWTYF
jgi:hypothetical protein